MSTNEDEKRYSVLKSILKPSFMLANMDRKYNNRTEKVSKCIGGSRVKTFKRSAFLQYSETQLKTIDALKELYRETVKLDMEFQCEVYKKQCSFEKKHNKIFDKRRKLLDSYAKKHDEGGLKHFWLNVLKSCYGDLINHRDEEILSYLVDIRYSSTPMNMSLSSFTIHFTFAENPFFTNKILTKTYLMRFEGMRTRERELEYDGSEIYSYKGSTVDWKNEWEDDCNSYNAFAKKHLQFSSFFDIFSPPEIPVKDRTPFYHHVKACLLYNFEMGFYLKERIIPKAILFYTGAIVDLQQHIKPQDKSEVLDDPDKEDDDNEDEEDYNEDDYEPQESDEDLVTRRVSPKRIYRRAAFRRTVDDEIPTAENVPDVINI